MRNAHTKSVEINHQRKTIRIVEKDRRNHIICASSFNPFDCDVEAMKRTAVAFGYQFHHGSDLISVYKEVS